MYVLLNKKKVKPKGSAVSDHLFFCNHSPTFESFSAQTKKKENSLIMRYKAS